MNVPPPIKILLFQSMMPAVTVTPSLVKDVPEPVMSLLFGGGRTRYTVIAVIFWSPSCDGKCAIVGNGGEIYIISLIPSGNPTYFRSAVQTN